MAHNNLIAQVAHQLPAISGSGISPGADQGVTALEKLISNSVGFLTLIAVLFFVFHIITAGYHFISSQGDEKKMIEARHRLTNGILGLAIVVLALGIGSLIATLLGFGQGTIFNLSTVFTKLKFN
ncbi:MAG: hypothetical protein WCG91_03535 [Candidatus Shapirobacteria bacterium]